MTRISERIGQLINDLRLSKNQFSKEIKTSSALISQIVANGKDSFRVDLIQKIVNRYPNINLSWLLLGEGDMWAQTAPIVNIDNQIESKEDEILFLHAKLHHVVEILSNKFKTKVDQRVLELIDKSISSIPYIDLQNATDYEKSIHLNKIEKQYRQMLSAFWKLFGE